MERGLIEMEWDAATAVEDGSGSKRCERCGASLKSRSVECLSQTLRDKLWLSWAHVKSSCDSADLMSFQTRDKKETTLTDLNQNGSDASLLFTLALKEVFAACGTCWKATNLHRQPVTIIWKEGLMKSLITAHCSEVWHTHWASWQTAWKKRGIWENAYTCWWLLNASLHTPRSKHTRTVGGITQLSIAAWYWTWQGNRRQE